MTSVLDMMTAGITERKQAKGVVLTPVGLERPARIPDLPTAYMPQEGIEMVVRTIRAAAADLIKQADAIEASLGKTPEQEKTDPAAEQRQREREADARVKAAAEESFADRQVRLAREAQAAAFRQPDPEVVVADAPPATPVAASSGSPTPGWTCPTHGDIAIVTLTSKRTKREYRACTTCSQFEK